MNYKILIYQFLFIMFLCLSCNETVIEEQSTLFVSSQPLKNKSATVGQTYYVSLSGNDANDGAQKKPFRTITHAADIARPGDLVIVADGIYSTNTKNMNMISCRGTEGNYITFQSESPHGAILDGNNISDYCFSIVYGASYVRFVDFKIRNFLRFGFDINHPGYPSSYISIEGCEIYNIGRINDTNDIGRCGIYIGQENHHISMDRNLIYDIGRTGPDNFYMNKDHAIYTADPYPDDPAYASHHNSITNNIIFNVSGCHLTLGSYKDLIANNVFAWVLENSKGGNCIIYTGSKGCFNETIANNIFYQPAKSSPFVIWAASGTSGWNVGNNMVYGGQMWYAKGSAGWASAMKGNNYGQKDCENAEVDPMFISAVRGNKASYDFRLQAKSPAVKKGVNLGLLTDFTKNNRNSPPDIGAIEYMVPQTIYYNARISATVMKDNCGPGFTGSIETYTVSANKYSSTVSQQDADAKASADLDANKQAYANAHGLCNSNSESTRLYYSAAITLTGAKNDCGPGYTGSTVTGTLPERSFSSTKSQAEADKLAMDYAQANKQAYFNNNGICIENSNTSTTKKWWWKK